MSYALGGVYIEELDMSYSWGLSPAGASVKTVASCSISPGDEAVITVGGFTFNGICTSPVASKNFGSGTKGDVKLADQRLLLMYDMVYASFNSVEVIEDNPMTPGIDRCRRYVHILPVDWSAQNKTYTELPLSAQTILDYCFGASTVHTTWTREYHSRQSSLVHEIEANSGKKLGSIIQEITEAQALVFALTADHTLTWVLKGEGDLPTAPAGCTDLSTGTALTSNDTLMTIVGDRNKHQVVIDLEPDWQRGWEAFWLQSDWVAEVNSHWGPYDSSQASQALLAAKAREVTVRDYVAITANDAFADMRKWGEGVCRMEIPAWLYLNDIVWKAYRVPPDSTINGSPLFAVADGEVKGLNAEVSSLLASVVGSTDGVISIKTPQELYPDGKAYVLVQGVDIELLDPSTQGLITQAQINNMSTIWSPCNRFTFDEKNLIIIFECSTFVPGSMDSGTGLYKFNNQGISGINNDDPLYNICVPNANVVPTPAKVKVCLCFGMERYTSAEAGSGTRRGSHYVAGLEKHLIDITSPSTEVTYLTGVTADDMAALYMSALIGQQPIYASGGYMRHGAAGTALSSVIDRVTVRVNFTTGLTERVELTKERMPAVFMGERDLDRKQRTTDLFPHQRELRFEARQLRSTAMVASHRVVPTAYNSLNDVISIPVGSHKSSVFTFSDSASWPAGMPVIFDKATGLASSAGTLFKGIVVADGATGAVIHTATTGTVPVLARSHFTISVMSTSLLSAIAATLVSCGGSSSTQSNSTSVDLALAINPGDMLYSIPSSGHNYVTPFDLTSVFHSVVQTILGLISTAINSAFSLGIPSLRPVDVTEGSVTVSPPTVSFPTLSITFPSLSFGSFDPCLPLSSGSDVVITAIDAYDFSSAFTAVNTLIDAFDPTFDASLTLPNIDASALEADLEAAIQALLCSLASVVDDVISNLDEIIQILEAIIVDYLTRKPVGIAGAALSTTVTGSVLIPVTLNSARGAEMQFNKELSDAVFTILKDIPLFGLAPARTVADLFSNVIPLLVTGIQGMQTAVQTALNTLAGDLAAGVQGALEVSKSAVTEVVGLIQAEHTQVKALLSDYAAENKTIVEAAEQYMLKTAVSGANLMIDYLKAPYIASPKIVLLPSPYPSLTEIDQSSIGDFCDLATAFTTLAAQLADPAIPTLSTASYIDDQTLMLVDPDSTVTVASGGTSSVVISNGDIDLGSSPTITLDGSIGDAGDILVSDGTNSTWASTGASEGDLLMFTGGSWSG